MGMGSRDKWLSKIKKALNPGSKLRIKSKKTKSEPVSKWFAEQNHLSPVVAPPVESVAASPLPLLENVRCVEEQMVTICKTITVETLVSSEPSDPKTASDIGQSVTASRLYVGESKEETAAIRIQTAFRRHLARRTLQAMRGLIRIKSLVQGPVAKRQATDTLQCMQTLVRVQSQILSSRVQMCQENQALQRQQRQRGAKHYTSFRNADEWKDTARSKQQDEATLRKKQEAAIKRERTLAYSSAQQQTWKNSPKRTSNATNSSDSNQGWSWLERWMAARPWEEQIAAKEGMDCQPLSSQGIAEMEEETKAQASRKVASSDKLPPSIKTNQKSPPNAAMKVASMTEKSKSGSPRMMPQTGQECDTRRSHNSEKKNRRHSFGGSSSRDHESSAGSNSPGTPVVLNKLPKTRPSLQSPLGIEHNRPAKKAGAVQYREKPQSQLISQNNPRRYSAPPKVNNRPVSEQNEIIMVEVS